MSDLNERRAAERAIVTVAAQAVSGQWGYDLVRVEYPEDQKPPPHRPIDGVAITSGPTIAIEHTLHQSFSEQRMIASWFRELVELAQEMSGTLPTPGSYDLGVSAEALRGKGRVDLRPLAEWIREQAPRLTAGLSAHGVTNVVEGGPPDLPFPVRLLRTEPAAAFDGILRITSPIDMNALPALNLTEMKRTLERKLPKLEEHRPAGGRTLLVLENQDIQLVNPDNVGTAVRSAIDVLPHLAIPDAIVMIHAIGYERGITWVKDGDLWNSVLNRHYRPLPPAEPT